MKLVWMPNPLATRVELDAHERARLRLRLEVEDLRERISMAHFELHPEHREWHNQHLGQRTLDDAVGSALAILDSPHSAGSEEREGKTFAGEMDEDLAAYVSHLEGAHSGDCTCEPSSCVKCRAEELVGAETIAGLGKHEGSCIASTFASPEVTIEQAIDTLRRYRPVKGKGWKNSDEEFQTHVPRWREEAKRALAWLLVYQAEHFK